MNNYIDLRSDTVTKPSKEMREVIALADVGDDVYGEDPTVNQLQDTVAKLLGKENALFVPSGTMANQVSIKTHTQPGDEIIAEADAHIFQYETAAPAFISQIQVHTIHGKYGMVKLQDIEDAIRPQIYYYPRTRLICLENTHNRAGGTILDIHYIKDVHTLAKAHDIKLHLDGARLWNASIATGISMEEYGLYFDSVSVCLSKGLGAPIGSLICSSKEFIEKTHKYRKILGGGMRQVGILAAAGLYAVENNFKKLAEDHKRARYLAEFLTSQPNIFIDMESVQTNILNFSFKNPKINIDDFISNLKENFVLAGKGNKNIIRLVTHLDINDNDIERSIQLMKRIFPKY
jgi:threonine aldolase